nr:retrovirus-related Pol polyprotein from transposon TNT 1-94 [Tanacetum cinerariifolium]
MHNNIMAAGSRDRPPMLATTRLCPENKAHYESEKEAIHLILTGIRDEIYSTVDACKTSQEFGKFPSHDGETMESYYIRFYKMVNEMIKINLTVATMQVNVQFLQQLQPKWSRHKGKEIAKPITPPSGSASEEDSDPEQAQRDKDMQKNLALIFKRTVNVAGARENVGSLVVQQSGIQCFICKEFGHFAKECRKPKGVKDSTYHKEKIYMAKIQEVPTVNSGTDSEPLEQVQNDTRYNVCANALQHYEQSESINNTCVVETDDSNVIPDSPNMCDNDIQNDQNDVKCDDEQTSKTLEESNSVRDSCLVALQTKQTEFEKYMACNDRTVDYDKLEQKHSISLELALQECQELMKNDTVCKEKASNVFQKEREQYFKIQDLKAQLQDKNIAISELKKLIKKCKGKYVETKFDKLSVVRKPNAQRIPKPPVLGKAAPFSDSLERKSFSKTKSVPKTNVSEGLSKPITIQILHQTAKQAIEQQCPSGYKWVPKIKSKWVPKTKTKWVPKVRNENSEKRVSFAIDNIVQLILFIVDSGCTKHMTGNLSLLCNFVEKYLGTVRFGNDQFALILGYGDLVQVNIIINMVYYIEGLNDNLFLVGQFCDADLEVAFWKSTCFVRDLQGNNLLIDNCGFNLYTISLQESNTSTPLYLMAKASPNQAWLWHQRLSHLNFDYINLFSKKNVVIGLPKLKYVKDQLCSSCEVSKAKRSSFKTKSIPSSKGRLNLLHMDLCGPMRITSINEKKYILVIVDDYSRYTWTLFLRSKDETPEVLTDFLMMIQRNLQALEVPTADSGTDSEPVEQ